LNALIGAKIKDNMMTDPLIDPNPRWVSSISIIVKQLRTRSTLKSLIFW